MLYCQNPICGCELKEGEKFCPVCGTKYAPIELYLEECVDGDWRPIKSMFWSEEVELRLRIESKNGQHTPDCSFSSSLNDFYIGNLQDDVVEVSYRPPMEQPHGDLIGRFTAEENTDDEKRWMASASFVVYRDPELKFAKADDEVICCCSRSENRSVTLSLNFTTEQECKVVGKIKDQARASAASVAKKVETPEVDGGFPFGLDEPGDSEDGIDDGFSLGTEVSKKQKEESISTVSESCHVSLQCFETDYIKQHKAVVTLATADDKYLPLGNRDVECEFEFLGRLDDVVRNVRFKLKKTFHIKVQNEPVLALPEQTHWNYQHGQENEPFKCEIKNLGKDNLRVSAVWCQDPTVSLSVFNKSELESLEKKLRGTEKSLTKIYEQIKSVSFPVTIEGQSSLYVGLKWNSEEIKEGAGKFSIFIDAELADEQGQIGPGRDEFEVEWLVREAEFSSGVLAVDFGTAASCAAVALDGCEKKVYPVDLDANASDHCALDSYVKYGYDREYKAEQFGVGAYELIFNYEGLVVPPAQHAIKRDLGGVTTDNTPVEYTLFGDGGNIKNLRPEDVMVDIYAYIARKVRQYVASGKLGRDNASRNRFKNFAITGPCNFTRSQLKLMRDAADKAFRKEFNIGKNEKLDIMFFDEPLAAAMSYLNDEEVQREWHRGGDNSLLEDVDKTLLIYDCGGGTTDLCLLKIQSKCRKVSGNVGADIVRGWDIIGKPNQVQVLQATIDKIRAESTTSEEDRNFIDQHGEDIVGASDRSVWQTVFSKNRNIFRRFLEAIMEIVHSNAGQQDEYNYVLNVEIIGATGDEKFGGVDMTKAVCDLLVDKLGDKRSEFFTNDIANGDVRKHVNWNKRKLWDLAERIKIKMATYCANPDLSVDDYFFYSEIIADSCRPEDELVKATSFQRIKLKELFGEEELHYTDVTDAVAGKIRTTIDACSELITSCGEEKVDTVLMTGRASSWPYIGGALKSIAHKVVKAKEQKHCVSEGAALQAHRDVKAGTSEGAVSTEMTGVFVKPIEKRQFITRRLGITTPSNDFGKVIGVGTPFKDNKLSGQTTIEGSVVTIATNSRFDDRGGALMNPLARFSFKKNAGILEVSLERVDHDAKKLRLVAKLDGEAGECTPLGAAAPSDNGCLLDFDDYVSRG